jgi:hypothetical protein
MDIVANGDTRYQRRIFFSKFIRHGSPALGQLARIPAAPHPQGIHLQVLQVKPRRVVDCGSPSPASVIFDSQTRLATVLAITAISQVAVLQQTSSPFASIYPVGAIDPVELAISRIFRCNAAGMRLHIIPES